MSFSEWSNKKKKKEEEKKESAKNQSFSSWSNAKYGVEDIAPVVTTKKDEGIAPVKERTWFDTSALDDGFQWSDIPKVIIGTATDIGENLGSGIIGIGEKLLDAGATLGAAMNRQNMMQAAESEMIYNTISGKGNGNVLQRYLDSQKKVEEDTAAFVAKDLYDEEAVAKQIITAPVKHLTGVDAETDSILGEKSDSLVQSAGQLGAQIGLNALVPGSGMVLMGATSFGSEAESAYMQGASFHEGLASATISAGAEVLTEKIGGISFGGKTLTDAVVSKFAKNATSKLANILVSTGKFTANAIAEGGEEILSGYLSAIGQQMTYMEDKEIEELFSDEEKLESFIGGFVLGGLGEADSIVKSAHNGVSYATELTKNEQAVVEKVYKDRVAEAEKDGKVTQKRKNEIYDKVLEDMDKGYISTDTIEEVLGGDSYKTYKDASAKEEAVLKELESLYEGEELAKRQQSIRDHSTLSELKGKLGQAVSETVRNDRLSESYNERSRRRQKYEADLSGYDEKQRKVVQKAIDSGVLNNTNRSHELVDLIAKIGGDKELDFDFTNNEKLKESGFALDGVTVNGFVNENGVTVNVNSAKALNSVVGHEITHVLEGTEVYTELEKALTEHAKGKNEYDTRLKKLVALYENVDGYKGAEGYGKIKKELIADLAGDYLFTDKEFVNRLSTEHRNVFQKIFDEVKYLCRVAAAGSKEARELERVKKVFEEAYRTESAFTDEVKYSITAKMTDAERYVDLKDKSIAVITETATAEYADEVSSLEELKRKAKGKAEKIIYPLANKLGITTKKLSHEDIDVEFIFSKNGGLKESLNKQFRYGGDYADFAKALINLDRVLDSAVLIEIHGDKYQGTTRANENLESVYVLLGAFQDGKNIIPVQMEIKKSSDVGGRLYMTVALTKIEADVLGSTPEKVQTRSLIPASNYSLADVVREINPEDAHFLKYLPDDMLSAAQIAAKNKALEEDAKRIEGYRKGIAPVMSLSEQNQLSNNDMFPLSWQVKGKDVALEGLAPVAISKKETTTKAPMAGDTQRPAAAQARREVVLPTPEDIAKMEAEREAGRIPLPEDIALMEQRQLDAEYRQRIGEDPTLYDTDEDEGVETTRDKLEVKRKNLERWLNEMQYLRDHLGDRIAELQAKHAKKKNKESKSAEKIERQIMRLQVMKANPIELDKKIHQIQNRIGKLDERLQTGKPEKADRLEKIYKRIDTQMEYDERELTQEFNQKRNILNEEIKDRGKWIRTKAADLEWEMGNWVKGTSKSSPVLKMMRSEGYEWRDIMGAASAVKNDPNQITGKSTPAEMALRELLGREYDEKAYELEKLETEYKQRLKELKEGAEEQREFARRKEQRQIRTELHQQKMDVIKTAFSNKGMDFDSVLKKAKDLSTLATVDNTPQRVMEKSLGYKEGGVLADLTVNKVAQNETEGIKWLNTFTDRKNGVLAQISKQYNIKPGSKESAAAQMYAEGFYVDENKEIIQYGDAELAQDFTDAKVRENIKKLARDPRIRQIYDETLAAINESRTRNLYPEIPRLNNYFLHFRAMEDTFSRLGLPFNPNDIKAKDLPTDLNGVTADLKPGQPYFASAMHRKGKRTSFDLLGGLEKYLTSAKNQIYHIDDIQTLRALRNYVADTYGQANGLEGLDVLSEEEAQDRIEKVYNSHLSTFAKFLNEEANILAGKTALIDRGLEGIIGRRGITFLDSLNKQVGSNMVGYNISSSLTNVIPVAQTFAKTNKADFVKAFGQTVANKVGSIFGRSDGFTKNSPVAIRRKGADRFYRTVWQKIGDPGYAMMGAVDNISTELIARTKYNEFTRKGMDSQQAHYETDKWVSRLMGDRSLGQMPQLYNSRMLGLVTKFQLEVRNQLDSQFYDTIQEARASNEEIQNGLARNAKTAAKVASTFVQLAVVQHLFGKAFESVAGYNPAFDIIETIIKTLGWDDDEESEDTVLDNIEQGFLNLLEDLPYASTFLDGGRIPISSALPIEELIKGEDEYGNEKSRWETLGEVAPYYLMPGGYGQLKKTKQGLHMFSDEHPIAGSYTDSGNLRFPVDDTLLNRVQAGIFGQWANANARDYFDNERKPLNEKQIQEFMDVGLSIQDYWKYREGLSGLSKLAEKADYIDSLDLTDEQKNILINNIADRKEDIDMSDYSDYGSFEEFDFAAKNPEKYSFLQENNVSYEEYKNFDDDAKDAYNWAFNNPEKFTLSKAVASDVVTYRKYTRDLFDIKADKDESGKSISGSRKEKVIDYINNMDADYGEKIILFKSLYESEDTYNYDIVEYLNEREDISYEEMVTILKELGFTVSSDGTVSW